MIWCLRRTLGLFKFILIATALALSLQAGTIGLVEPGENPNYDVQIPGAMFINLAPAVPLEVLLGENPQYYFAFWRNESGAELFAYFDPVLPSTQVIVTTQATPWLLRDEPNFERFAPPIVVPPVEPPPCTHNCSPVVPPVHPPSSCVDNGTCHLPVCLLDCGPAHPPPGSDVPEPSTFLTLTAGAVLIALHRLRKK